MFYIILLLLNILSLLYFIFTLTLFVKYSRISDKRDITTPDYAPTCLIN